MRLVWLAAGEGPDGECRVRCSCYQGSLDNFGGGFGSVVWIFVRLVLACGCLF